MNETDPEDIADPGPVPLVFSASEVTDILPDLPGGQGVSPSTRRLFQQLHDARRRGAQLVLTPPDPTEDVFHAAPVLVRQPPREQPRRALVLCRKDGTGTTGVGIIAEGCRFSDGAVVWRRLDEPGWQFTDRAGADSFARANPALVVEVIWIDDTDEPS